MTRRYKAILVGNGTMGKRHRSRFEACGVLFVAVVDSSEEFEGVANKLIDVDFAVIASPAITHNAYTKYFLERNIPVFVEKPLATTGMEAQELVDLARKKDLLLFVAQSECYNPIFLNFRKHFLEELKARNSGCEGVHLEFRREHRYSERCRDVDASLDLLVHDLSLFLMLFRKDDIRILERRASVDSVRLRVSIVSGEFRGVDADFWVNRNSDRDIRTITVGLLRTEDAPQSNYTVSLARYGEDGEIAHIPDSLENEHRFFLKLLAGACGQWGRRAAQSAADCVKIAASLPF